MDENLADKRHRQFSELQTDVRVVLPGVQVLFAFLLSLPFLSAAHHLGAAQRVAYFISFFSTTITIALLVAPSAYHRVRFEQRYKEDIITSGNALTMASLAFLAVAMVAAVFVVTVQWMGTTAGTIVTVVAAVLFGYLWYLFPATRRSPEVDEDEESEATAPDGEAAPAIGAGDDRDRTKRAA